MLSLDRARRGGGTPEPNRKLHLYRTHTTRENEHLAQLPGYSNSTSSWADPNSTRPRHYRQQLSINIHTRDVKEPSPFELGVQ